MIPALSQLLNPDLPWSETNMHLLRHSMRVGEAAFTLAQHLPLDPQKAFEAGLLHDLGKFYLPASEAYKHPRLGYEMLKQTDLDFATICLMHPFLCPDSQEYIAYYCHHDSEEASALQTLLRDAPANPYIPLIQLCDKLAGRDHYLTIEQKCAYYEKKYGAPTPFIQKNIDALHALKSHFDALTHTDIYALLNIQHPPFDPYAPND